MKKNKILIALILCIIFSLCFFQGCGKGDNLEKEVLVTQNIKNDSSEQTDFKEDSDKKEELPQKEEITIKEVKEEKEDIIKEENNNSYEELKADEVQIEENINHSEEEKDKQYIEEKETIKQEEPQKQQEAPEEILNLNVCSLTVRCDSVFDNLDKLKSEKAEILPQDGIILKEENLEFYEGESVYDLILRELKKRKIHFDFVYTPQYNSAYIKGIANLYEFDVGSMSGWLYKVNGEKPLVGTSQYIIKNNDKIEIYYSCNLSD